jgi:PHD/YefM family antitoxin component YafN of YafNO toxin-antitoxin module
MVHRDIFKIVEEDGKFYAVFKHNDQKLNPLSPCEWAVYAESLAYNWCTRPENQKKILEVSAELYLL